MKTKVLHIRIEDELRDKLRALAEKENRTLCGVIRNILKKAVK